MEMKNAVTALVLLFTTGIFAQDLVVDHITREIEREAREERAISHIKEMFESLYMDQDFREDMIVHSVQAFQNISDAYNSEEEEIEALKLEKKYFRDHNHELSYDVQAAYNALLQCEIATDKKKRTQLTYFVKVVRQKDVLNVKNFRDAVKSLSGELYYDQVLRKNLKSYIEKTTECLNNQYQEDVKSEGEVNDGHYDKYGDKEKNPYGRVINE
jgi:uncharacterized membrane-anchored protein YjiN (DUF445 family)